MRCALSTASGWATRMSDDLARCAVCNVSIERVFEAGYGEGTCQHWIPPFVGPTRIFWTCCEACMIEFDTNRDEYVSLSEEE